jgi:flagellar biosynthesis component FlhA
MTFGKKGDAQSTASSQRKGRIKDIILLALLAFALLFAAWRIFRNGEEDKATASATENERKVAQLLQEIEGVGEAEIVVCEDENGVKSVVVVCDGANNFRVIMDVREAVAAALGTEESAVKIYQKKD